MELSEWVLYTIAEVILVLVILCLLLLFHAKGLKAALLALQKRLARALQDLKDAKASQASGTDSGVSYADQVKAHIKTTQAHHASLSPDRNIDQDIAPDTPSPRMVAAMRNRFLKAEQDAIDQEYGTDWSRLAEHYQLLMPQETASELLPPPPDALDYEQQRAEIERFKRLFHTMEAQWVSAKAKAEQYYAQLVNVIGDSDDPGHQQLRELAESQLNELKAQPKPGKVNPEAASKAPDLASLKAINAQQRREIEELQRRLQAADLETEQGGLVQELEQQLSRQLKLMKESEVCIELLEQELADVTQRMHILEHEHKRIKTEQLLSRKEALAELTKEKQQLSKKIRQLESENEQLAGLAELADAEQRRKLTQKDQEISAIKQKFTELAKRYKAAMARH